MYEKVGMNHTTNQVPTHHYIEHDIPKDTKIYHAKEIMTTNRYQQGHPTTS